MPTPTIEDIIRFRDLFVGTAEAPKCHPSFLIGTPDKTTNPTGKVLWDYYNALKNNPFRVITNADIRRHLLGIRSLVISPDLPGGFCYWGGLDDDVGKFSGYRATGWVKDIFNIYRSKSGGIHAIYLPEKPEQTELMHRFLRVCQIKLDWWKNKDTQLPCESFPDYRQKDKVGGHRTCLNMPFFGEGRVGEIHHGPPILAFLSDAGATSEPTHAKYSRTSDSPATNEDPGCWGEDSLVAMLNAYKEFIPDFEFKPLSGGFYEVPCPGNRKLGGWPDGNMHSDTDEPILSDKTVVFVRNGYPKFKCMHGHCDGEYGQKKTINSWRQYFDPGDGPAGGELFFNLTEWLDEYVERLSQ